jgi:predicted ATP-grasp superfamily ATP-dependent carboligase
MNAPRLPALLFDARYYGTLAAVRSLGSAKIPVFVADPDRLTPSGFSRYATRVLRSPPVAQAKALIDWLVRFGQREGGAVLYPTSDEMAFLLAAHRRELEPRFALYSPELETVIRILDKRKLLDAAREAGVDAPETFFPETAAEADRVGREADGPLLLKPRTQLFLELHSKGMVVPRGSSVGAELDAFRKANRYLPPIADGWPELAQPMIQRYYATAADAIYSVSGFRSKAGRNGPQQVMRGSVKLCQSPRRLGVGICFESAEIPADIRQRTSRLLDVLGYHGVFELEFIEAAGRHMLIDMNPRYYGQMQFDVARGTDLPRLAYAGAIGDEDELARLMRCAKADEPPRSFAYCNGIALKILVGAQRAAGVMSRADAVRWREWRRTHGTNLIDSTAADDDVAPHLAEGVGHVYGCLRHPRAFLRMIALDR